MLKKGYFHIHSVRTVKKGTRRNIRSTLNVLFLVVLAVDLEYLKIPDVGEEEAEEGEGQRPLGHRADDVSCVALKEAITHTQWSSKPSHNS